MDSSRTSGFAISSISSAKIEPIWANWSRCSGRASAFAPESRRTDGPSRAGTDDGDRRPVDLGQAPDEEEARRRASRPCSRRRRLRPHRLLRRPDRRRRASCRAWPALPRPASRASRSCPRPRRAPGRCVSSVAGPKRIGWIAARRGLERARDDLVRATVAAHRVDGDTNWSGHPWPMGPACGAARLRGPGTSCRSGTRGAAASAGGRPGTRSRAAP